MYKTKLRRLTDNQRLQISRTQSKIQERIEVTEKALRKAKFFQTCKDSIFVAQLKSIAKLQDIDKDNQKFEAKSLKLDSFEKNLDQKRAEVKCGSETLKREGQIILNNLGKDERKLVPGMKVLAKVNGKYRTCFIAGKHNETYQVQAPPNDSLSVDGGSIMEWRPEHHLMIQLFVRTPFAGIVVVSVRFDTTVAIVKDMVLAKARSKGENLDRSLQDSGRLTYCSKLLEGHRDLIFYGIDDQATLTYQILKSLKRESDSADEIEGTEDSDENQEEEIFDGLGTTPTLIESMLGLF